MTKRPALNSTHFPFTALVGQTQAQLTLLLAAIDPLLGGVLIEGGRGTAKSTMARGLAPLLDAPFVNLPLGASEEQLVGTLDLEAVLNDKKVHFRPGLLAKAHTGILYVDEVNLLPDHLVDLLLDTAASGMSCIERDGISHTHDARFVLIGTMNPDEGEIRPQLLDRFGLSVSIADSPITRIRQQIVTRRLAYDLDAEAFTAAYQHHELKLKETLIEARRTAPSIDFTESVIEQAADRCAQEHLEGVRADLSLLRAARAYAALNGSPTITTQHIDAVAELALRHRRKSKAEPPGKANPPSRRPPNTGPSSQDTSQMTADGFQNAAQDTAEVPIGQPLDIGDFLEKKC